MKKIRINERHDKGLIVRDQNLIDEYFTNNNEVLSGIPAPIYFVNPLGSSTSPYETRAKGATNFKTLLDNITQASGNIIEVCDGGEIDDTAVVIPNITVQMVIRSHSGNSSKPIMKIRPNDTGLGLITGAWQVQILNIIMKKYGTPSSSWITWNPGTSQLLRVEGCEFWGENPSSSPNAIGVLIANPGTFAVSCDIEDNDFYNCWNHVEIQPLPA